MFQEEDETQLVCTVKQGPEVIGYVAIDSSIGGCSCGGLRMLPDIDEAEIRKLARSMTLKYGFLGLPQGGAKAGIRCDPEAPLGERRQRLANFGRAIAPLLLNRVYTPHTDMGTNNDDIRYMLNEAGMRIKRRELRGMQSGYYTALTVFACAKQAMRHLGLHSHECSAAIEGFGKVGSALGSLLAAGNVHVKAISTSRGAIYNPKGLDIKKLSTLAVEVGSRVVDLYEDAERIDPAVLFQLPVDLICPCARHDSVHAGNADQVVARMICPGANNPVTSEAEHMLSARGILCLPDFVANSGGVLGGTMEFASVAKKQIELFIEYHFSDRIAWLLRESTEQRVLPREIAVPLAMYRFDRVRHNAANPTFFDRFIKVGLELYRRGWVPGRLVAHLARPYFKRAMA